jgi:hypothetical protein
MYEGWPGERQRPSSVKSNDAPSPTNNTTSQHESDSFESVGRQLTYESQEQYAQRPWTPIPASSQLSSNQDPLVEAPVSQIQAANPACEGLEAPEHVLTQESRVAVAQDDVVMIEADLQGSFSTLSFQSTQPTLILDEPWSKCFLTFMWSVKAHNL